MGNAGGRRKALGRRRTSAQADAGQARRRAANARDTAWTRGGAWQAQAGARGAAGWAACARLVCSVGPGWVFWCT